MYKDDTMLESYLLKYSDSDVDVDSCYAGQDVEVIYDKYTGEFEMIIS